MYNLHMPQRKSEIKDGRTREILRELASEYISRESNQTSLITVTNIIFDYDTNRAKILVSVMPDYKIPAVKDFLDRNVGDFRKFAMENSSLGRVPFFSFEIDYGEKNRQRIDELGVEDSKRGVSGELNDEQSDENSEMIKE